MEKFASTHNCTQTCTIRSDFSPHLRSSFSSRIFNFLSSLSNFWWRKGMSKRLLCLIAPQIKKVRVRDFPGTGLFCKRWLSRTRSFCSKNEDAAGSSRGYTVKEVKVPVPGGVIAGKLWESAAASENIPPTVCVHGWLDNAGTFDTLIPLLIRSNPGQRFLALDLPGHGLTTYCTQWLYDGHMDGVIGVQRMMRHMGWERIRWLGHSMGGILGFIFTGLFPEQVERLAVLENMRPMQRPFTETMRASIQLVFDVEERERLGKKAYPYSDLLERFYEGRQGTVSMEGCKILLERGAIPAEEDKFHFSYNFRTLIPGQEGRLNGPLVKELASQISCPICFIKADPGNVYETEKEREEFFSLFKGKLERHKAEGTHHFHLDNPIPVANILNKFFS